MYIINQYRGGIFLKETKVISLNRTRGYRFVSIPIWVDMTNNRNGEIIKNQYCMIGLKCNKTELQIIHPISDFIVKHWISNKYNTQRKHCNNIIGFLNYILENDSLLNIRSMQNLKLEHVTLFLNSLSQDSKARTTVNEYQRTLTRFYFWLSKKGIITDIQPEDFIKVEGVNGNYYESPFENVILPPYRPVQTEHMLPIRYIPLVLEIAMIFAKPIVLGLYMQIFGGLRVGELMNLKRTSTLRVFNSGSVAVTV